MTPFEKSIQMVQEITGVRRSEITIDHGSSHTKLYIRGTYITTVVRGTRVNVRWERNQRSSIRRLWRGMITGA